MKNKELKVLGKHELKNKSTELKKDFVKLNAQRRSGAAMKNPEQLKQIKKTIARILHLSKQNKEE